MPAQIGTNLAKQKLAANELVLCFGVIQLPTPNMLDILSGGRADVKQIREAAAGALFGIV